VNNHTWQSLLMCLETDERAGKKVDFRF